MTRRRRMTAATWKIAEGEQFVIWVSTRRCRSLKMGRRAVEAAVIRPAAATQRSCQT
jgi:hypothetical protein